MYGVRRLSKGAHANIQRIASNVLAFTLSEWRALAAKCAKGCILLDALSQLRNAKQFPVLAAKQNRYLMGARI